MLLLSSLTFIAAKLSSKSNDAQILDAPCLILLHIIANSDIFEHSLPVGGVTYFAELR